VGDDPHRAMTSIAGEHHLPAEIKLEAALSGLSLTWSCCNKRRTARPGSTQPDKVASLCSTPGLDHRVQSMGRAVEHETTENG
jgi:hypothetical protein